MFHLNIVGVLREKLSHLNTTKMNEQKKDHRENGNARVCPFFARSFLPSSNVKLKDTYVVYTQQLRMRNMVEHFASYVILFGFG